MVEFLLQVRWCVFVVEFYHVQRFFFAQICRTLFPSFGIFLKLITFGVFSISGFELDIIEWVKSSIKFVVVHIVTLILWFYSRLS